MGRGGGGRPTSSATYKPARVHNRAMTRRERKALKRLASPRRRTARRAFYRAEVLTSTERKLQTMRARIAKPK